MQIIVTEYGGFCFGVERAVNTALSLNDGDNYILGELIHNEEVIKELESKGLKTVNSLSQVKDGATLLIRTHGVSKEIFEQAKEKRLNVIDCTCPFVKDIQLKVNEFYKKGYAIVIVGEASHPEVQGINGWCENSAFITDKAFDLSEIPSDKVCVVVQTTFSLKKFEEIFKNIQKDGSKTVEIFKTICYTTTKRQNEAEDIARQCDACLVLGGNKSNNTQKLFDICKRHCKNVFRASNPQEVDYEELKKYKKVGIVVGASTPKRQSQEVISVMENTEVKASVNEEVVTGAPVTEQQDTMEVAVAMMDNKSQKFRLRQVIKATISQATDDGLALYIPNTKKEVLLSKTELINEYNKEDYAAKIGDEIETMVVGLNPLVLSERAIVRLQEEEAAVAEIKDGKIFNVEITGHNKGGLTATYMGYQVFIPSSQIRIGFVKDLEKYVGKTMRLKAEKVENDGRNRKQIVGSQRVVLEAEKAERDAIRAEKEEAFFNSIEVGDIVKGTTQRFADFGAFVSVNGFDCLAHISDLSWTNCKKCSDVLELNKAYEFKILKIDRENKKVSIGYKQLQPKPWELVADKYHAGDVVKGKVVRIVSFGAFVEVEPEVDGLVHVSQISNEWLENPTSALKVGEEIEAKILEIDTEKEKMTLSIKALLPEVEKKPKNKEENTENNKKVRANKDEEDTLREWKDDNGSVSIAEILGNIE